MADISKHLKPTLTAIQKYWEDKNEKDGHRAHLGASLIGEVCLRKLWYTFRHCKRPSFSGRMYRLFDRGQREEEVFVEELRGVGVTIIDVDKDGNQIRVSDIGGHFGGSLDGFITSGLKESSKPHVAEFKTHNDKSFKELVKVGVEEAKPLHYAQMQIYMHYTEVDRALYMAANKNDDTLYTERVKYCKKTALALIEKARTVIESKEPPLRLTDNATDWRCRFCDYSGICHENEVPEVNCRTCAHSTPVVTGTDGKWTCDKHGDLPSDTSFECPDHLFTPSIFSFASAVESDGSTWVKYIDDDFVEFTNGVGGKTSKEIYDGQM